MNADLLKYCRRELARHIRTVKTPRLDGDPLSDKTRMVESCACGRLEVQRIVAPNGRGHALDLAARARAVEDQWRDHVIEVVAGAVAVWLAAEGELTAAARVEAGPT